MKASQIERRAGLKDRRREDFRRQAALAALSGVSADKQSLSADECASWAWRAADALLEKE
jgi:hypothetical protein